MRAVTGRTSDPLMLLIRVLRLECIVADDIIKVRLGAQE